MSLRARISEAVKLAMKAGDKERVKTLRLLTAAIKQREVDERIEADDGLTLSIIDKMVKQRRESIEQFTTGGRADLAARENAEIEVLKEFLPEPLSQAQIDAAIVGAIQTSGAQSVADMGRVMAALKPQLQGRADMKEVSVRVRAQLAG